MTDDKRIDGRIVEEIGGWRLPRPGLCLAAGAILATSALGLVVGTFFGKGAFICGCATGAALIIGLWIFDANAGD